MSDYLGDDWLIIAWDHIDHQDAAYGKLLARFRGTEEEAKDKARLFVPDYKPVGIVREIK